MKNPRLTLQNRPLMPRLEGLHDHFTARHGGQKLMARKRMLSPNMFTSETIGALPVATRWTWTGLLTYLDDFGRGKDNPALIKAAVWPLDESYTSKKVAADLDRLAECGTICRFLCCQAKQLHAPNWTAFQKVSHPTDSTLCPCPECDRDLSVVHKKAS